MLPSRTQAALHTTTSGSIGVSSTSNVLPAITPRLTGVRPFRSIARWSQLYTYTAAQMSTLPTLVRHAFAFRRKRSAIGFVALALAACGGEGARDKGAITQPSLPVSQFELSVQVTDGVIGSPVAGSSQQNDGALVAYQFSAAPGYRDLEVRLDGSLVGASGTVRMVRSRALMVTAFPTPPAIASPETAIMQHLYASASPAAAAGMLRQVMAAALAGDTARTARFATAEAVVLEQLGPEPYHRLSTELAGRSILVAGDSTARVSALLAASSSDITTFPTDTVVPTTVVFINGMFNTSGSARASAEALRDLLIGTGFGGATFLRHPGSARQAATMRVYLHFNPMVALQNPVVECISTLSWAFTVANGLSSNGSKPSVWLRVQALLDKVRRVSSVCTDPAWFSTNVRALDQFLTANALLLSPPDANDRALIELLEDERALAGGRNVWVIGHSQGSMIARTAVASLSPVGGAENVGCSATLAIGSPLSNTLPWPGSDSHQAVIQKGSVDGSEDLVYNLLGAAAGRTDGQLSGLTNALDDDLRNNRVWWPLLRRIDLHRFDTGYLAQDGLRVLLGQRARELYARVGTACSGTLEGVVGDLGTRLPIAGAKVQAMLGEVARATATTALTGSFRTPPLFPVLHNLVVTAPGYDTVTLTQRLVPFRGRGLAQGGTILIGRACSNTAACRIEGTYTTSYQLSGTIGSIAVACAFESRMVVTQTDSVFVGSITTDRYQEGCANGSGYYIFWEQGTTSMSGVQRGRDIVFTHAAIPPWQMTGRTFDGGFTAIEPLWKITNEAFAIRVELTATRISSTNNAARSVIYPHGITTAGPQLGFRR